MAQTREINQVRVKNEKMRVFLEFVLKEHHRLHGNDTWMPIPDLAEAAGMVPDATERLVRQMAEENEILMESCLALDIKDERYKRPGVEKGWWPAVKLLPREVVEARRRAIAEWEKKRAEVAEVIGRALHDAYPDAPWVVDVQETGKVVIAPVKDDWDGKRFVDEILAATTPAPSSRGPARSPRQTRSG